MPRTSVSPAKATLGKLSTHEYLLALAALILGSAMAWYAYAHGLITALTDQSSHLNFARLTFDSMTPGISQLGFWPPLLHILLLPFVAVPVLYHTGLAGAIVLVPCLALSVVLLYRITLILTDSRTLSLAAALLVLLNPYVLYYSATPMMETLFLTNLLLATYFLLRWVQTDRLQFLLIAALAISLSCLSRFEGFMLLPTTGLIILAKLVRDRISRPQIEALFLLFGLLALLGLWVIAAYSWVYGNSPLAFAGGDWLRDPSSTMRPARFSIATTLRDISAASAYMIGWPLIVLSCLSIVFLIAFRRRAFLHLSALLTVASPLLFVLLTLYLGMITINVPELPPGGIFHNDRYSLTSIGFVILAPLVVLGELGYILSSRLSVPRWIVQSFGTVIVGAVIAFAALQSYTVAFAEQFDVIRKNINVPTADQKQVAEYLRTHYNGGKILAARVDNDPIFSGAGIPLKNYLYEANYRIFDQAVTEPWLFARWIVLHNPEGNVDGWVQQSEPVYRVIGELPELPAYFDLVLENPTRRVYRLNENHVLQLAKERGFNPGRIPSLNPAVETWDTSTVYALMTQQVPDRIAPKQLALSRADIKSQLLEFYWNRLKPAVSERGYVVDDDHRGNSESQSYAMLQAMTVDDPETFETVWQWTAQNLQQPDGLFAWQYHIDGTGHVVIDDVHSATDADTDIAVALLWAGKRWSRPEYTREAQKILDGIWDKEVITVNGKSHIVAGNWVAQDPSGDLIINPSYFSPTAYRLFSSVDPYHDWQSLIATGYQDLIRSSRMFEERTGVFLPPDWVQYDPDSDTYMPFAPKGPPQYSFDAFRVFWRVAEDAFTADSSQARKYLQSVHVFDQEWENRYRLCSVYLSQTLPGDNCRVEPVTVAGLVSQWALKDTKRAVEMLGIFAFASGRVNLPDKATFYEQSWYWFMLQQWSDRLT